MSDFKAFLAKLKPNHQAVVEAYLTVGTWSGAACEVGVSKAIARRVGKVAKELGILDAAATDVAERDFAWLNGRRLGGEGPYCARHFNHLQCVDERPLNNS